MHDAVTIGIPVLAILFGILLNQRGLDKLEARMDARFGSMESSFSGIDGRLDRMQADLSMFYKNLGEHSADQILNT